MGTTAERTDVLILGTYCVDSKELWTALKCMRIPHALIFCANIAQLRAYLDTTLHEAILFLYADDEHGENLLDAILSLRHHHNLSIAVYDPKGNVSSIEDLFAMGANIYIHKPLDLAGLSRTIRQVMMMNVQFSSGNFNRETYFLSA